MLTIDEKNGIVLTRDESGHESRFPLASAEAFDLISAAWLRCGWDTKYVYGFSWMGRPIIQLPEDMFRIQEVIYNLKPDVIIETGVAHGGSLIFYAGLCKAMEQGRVVGIDIEIRKHNRSAIEAHELFPWISLIEGSSTAPSTIEQVKQHIKPGEKVLILLDSNHLKDHVSQELELYAPLVSTGSYIVACDGIMQQVTGGERTQSDWVWNNPLTAMTEFLSRHPEFTQEEPAWPFNEGIVTNRVTYWPKAFLRKTR